MTEITVRPLTEEEWDEYRSVRLAALQESPEAFVASYEEEVEYDEEFWRLRMRRSERLLAEQDGEGVGIVSIGGVETDDGDYAELFGLWVTPSLRGKGVATKLVTASAEKARDGGKTHLNYWVGTENGRAVAFASGFGFRPTDQRRPVRVESEADGEEEIAMVLSLAQV
ncbi:MAG: GNAT family N-acetyltransferase [Actinomycetia bacterium]|nr:GNAT family N-acetyltransferase [Actinomycetes bacterium]